MIMGQLTQLVIRLAVHLFSLLCLSFASTLANAALPTAAGQFEYPTQMQGRPAITVWYYKPARMVANTPVVFVMHGLNRDGERYRDQWLKHAEKHGFFLVVPEFSAQAFSTDAYQFGNVAHPDPQQWTFTVIERLFDEIKTKESLTTPRYSLYGHSAGAQFVHRFMLFMPSARVETAISANAGSYTLPIYPSLTQARFPWSLDPAMVSEAQLKTVFQQKLIILLGEKDTDPFHPQLPKTPQALTQGKHRLERGHTFYQAAKDQAAALKTPFNWVLATVSEVAHSNSGMAKAAVGYLFGR